MLQRPLPPEIALAIERKIRESSRRVTPRSGKGVLALPINDRFFALAAGQQEQLSTGWKRGFLLIQNTSLVDVLYVSFDKPATAQSMQIAAGGNFWPDVIVPSGSINVFATAAVTGIIVEG